MSEALSNEFDELVTKLRANLNTRHDDGDLNDQSYYTQIDTLDELVRLHNNSGWQSSGCAWESSMVC
jgi:hypothetical protein